MQIEERFYGFVNDFAYLLFTVWYTTTLCLSQYATICRKLRLKLNKKNQITLRVCYDILLHFVRNPGAKKNINDAFGEDK